MKTTGSNMAVVRVRFGYVTYSANLKSSAQLGVCKIVALQLDSNQLEC